MTASRFKVVHRTAYAFSGDVSLGEHLLMLRPTDSHDLRLIEASLKISPNADIRWQYDVFGNSVGRATFPDCADHLEITSELVLERFPNSEALRHRSMPVAYPFNYLADELMDLGALVHPDYPGDEAILREWITSNVGPLAPPRFNASTLLLELNSAIHSSIKYEAREAEGTQRPADTTVMGTGTCRDLAALMIDAARILGFGARFVTGYIYSEALDGGSKSLLGAASTHAWAEIYVPLLGWVSYDPTNDLVESADLIKVAVVRTARQARPISGVFTGPPGSEMNVWVDVTRST